VEKADTLIVMNQPSLGRFLPRLKRGGLLLYNSSLAKAPVQTAIDVRGYPFTETAAAAAGSLKAANMVALGAYIAVKKMFSVEEILEIIKEQKRDLLEMNRKALLAGIALVR